MQINPSGRIIIPLLIKYKLILVYNNEFVKGIYSQTSIKRSYLGERKSGLIRQVTSLMRFNSYEMFIERTRKM